MWTVVYVTQKVQEVIKIKTALGNNGVILRVRENSGSDSGVGSFEILVPAAELSIAQNLIIDAEI
jgi:hypothetical protein